MTFKGGDVQHMHAAASEMRPVVTEADDQARAASVAGRPATAAAGCPDVESAARSLAAALAKAVTDTGMAVGQLSGVAWRSADNLDRATSAE